MELNTGTVTLSYEKTGTGNPVILLHGNGEDHGIFDRTAALLAERFTVYALDSRGHGKSSPVREYHYEDMAEDVFQFIVRLGLKTPAVYGFSDGGIVGLLLAVHHKHLLSRLVVSGANADPRGLKGSVRLSMALGYLFSRSPKVKMMLHEPHITREMLRSICTETVITAGEFDMVTQKHTEYLHDNIPGSTLKIFKKETHGSYIVHSEKIASYLLEVLE